MRPLTQQHFLHEVEFVKLSNSSDSGNCDRCRSEALGGKRTRASRKWQPHCMRLHAYDTDEKYEKTIGSIDYWGLM